MRIKTVGWLAAAAMTLTSLTVWSVTPPGGFAEKLTESANHGAIDGPEVELDSWKFVTGETLKVEGRLGHSTMSSAQDSETYLYVNAQAAADAKATTAAPLNLAIVIDRSGSMSGKRLRNALDAARGMVNRLRDGDSVSVITYNTRAETLVPSTTISRGAREQVNARIETVVAGGDTCISCAIEAGMDALRGRNGIQRMLLLSDGQATNGVRDVNGFRRLAETARDMGCTISSVGVDVDYNEQIMTAIAIQSNGRHYFVENDAALSSIFDQELQSLVRTVATGAEMRLRLAPGVELMQVYDRAFRREGDTLVIPMGTFTAADNKTLLVKVRVPRGADGGRAIADVSLNFDDLALGKKVSTKGALLAKLSSDSSTLSELDPLVSGRLQRAETAATLREANKLFAKGNVRQARARLDKTRDRVRKSRGRFAPNAAPKRQAELEQDFDRQLAALDDASTGFAQPPPAAAAPGQPATIAAPPQATRAGRVQVRENASEAADFGL